MHAFIHVWGKSNYLKPPRMQLGSRTLLYILLNDIIYKSILKILRELSLEEHCNKQFSKFRCSLDIFQYNL